MKLRTVALLPLFALGWLVVEANLFAHHLFDQDPRLVRGLAEQVARDALRRPKPADFHTGSARFDGEWATGTCVMAIVGLGRMIDRAPTFADRGLPAMRACADQLADPTSRAFGTDAWGAGPEAGGDHAYLGYAAVAFGVLRAHDPEFAHAALHDRWVEGLAARVDAHGILALQTYPGERYPPDQAVVIAALHDHPDHQARAVRALSEWRAAIDPLTGLLRQTWPEGAPRGSGTHFAALWLARVDPELAVSLYEAGRRELDWQALGLGAMREYPAGRRGWGDIDSGPLVLGVSPSATGFALAGASTAGDRAGFVGLARTAHVFGRPVPAARGWRYATGFSLGNAILLTAILSRD